MKHLSHISLITTGEQLYIHAYQQYNTPFNISGTSSNSY